MINLSQSQRKTQLNVQIPETSPGPGEYTTSPSKSKSHTFSQSERVVSSYSTEFFQDSPGPGSYLYSAPRVRTSSRPFNSSEARFKSIQKPVEPGPTSYEHSIKPRVKTVKILRIHPDPVANSIPNIGRYEIYEFDGTKSSTGPGDYKPEISFTKPNSGNIILASNEDRVLWDHNNRATKINSRENIGPGKYRTEHPLKLYEFEQHFRSRSPRFKEVEKNEIGPGSYNIIVKNRSRGKFVSNSVREVDFGLRGEGKEAEVSRKLDEVKPALSSTYKSKTERMKLKTNLGEKIGPGTYNPQPFNKKIHHIFKESLHEESLEQTPGPGQYENFKSRSKGGILNSRAPRFRLIKEKTTYINTSLENPSPTEYEIKSTWGNKSFNLYELYGVESGRRENVSEESPGPAYYSPNKKEKKYGAFLDYEPRFKPGSRCYITPSCSMAPGSYDYTPSFNKSSHNINWMN